MRRVLHILGVLLFSSIVVLFSSGVYASEKLPENFKPQCYHFYDRLESFLLQAGETYKLDSNQSGFLLVQSGSTLPYKLLTSKDIIIETVPPFSDLTDNNPQTFIELDTGETTEFTFELGKKTIPQEFLFLYDFDLKYHKFQFSISLDGEHYDVVAPDSIRDFSFQFFKVDFLPLNPGVEIREAIKIRELSFRSSRKQYVFEAEYDTVLEVYGDYKCDAETPEIPKNTQNLKTSIDTPILYITLKVNPKYNTYTLFDRDNDWVEDSIDNCPFQYNPDQRDNNSDGVGNVCSDTDADGIIGYKDICPYTYNPKQYDVNANGIGDACEFDKDKDRIYDSVDNCLTVANPDQSDTDNDGIGDICDNCMYYNPSQLDTDENNVGDVCDQKHLDMEEHDKDRDGILDWGDNCPGIANANQLDTDRDGVGDVCDNCKQVRNRDQTDKDENEVGDICEDTDNDGFIGYLDNCMYTANNDQGDTDNNGIGNVCEDRDRDAKIHIEDNCPYIYNPDQRDVDGDGVGDICDGKDNRVLESNKTVFALLALLIVTIFGYGIYAMYRKLK